MKQNNFTLRNCYDLILNESLEFSQIFSPLPINLGKIHFLFDLWFNFNLKHKNLFIQNFFQMRTS